MFVFSVNYRTFEFKIKLKSTTYLPVEPSHYDVTISMPSSEFTEIYKILSKMDKSGNCVWNLYNDFFKKNFT